MIRGNIAAPRLASVLTLSALILVGCGTPLDSAPTSTVQPATATTTDAASNSNEATTTPATTTVPSTSTTASAPEVVLTSDGLGIVQFGAAPQSTIDALTSALGSPDRDSGWVPYSDSQPGFGYCGGTQWWMVRWGQLGVLFTNEADPVYAPEGQPHFAMYGYSQWAGTPPDETALRTPAGLTLGGTKDEVLALYGEAATFVTGDEIVEPYVMIDLGDANRQLALLDRETLTTVSIEGGRPCGE